MTKRMTLFSLFGFKVRLHSSWIILALLVAWSLARGYFPRVEEGLSTASYWIMGIVGVIGLFLSIVFHEFFHSFVARKYGLPMQGITLFIFGGIAEMSEEPKSPKVEGFMAIAGPLASVFLWLAFGAIALLGQQWTWPVEVNTVVIYLSQINLILAIFNMIPAFPLDGGRVLRAILWQLKGNLHWATRVAASIGAGFGIFMMFVGVVGLFGGAGVGGVWWIVLGLFLNFIARASRTRMEIKTALAGESVERFIQKDVPAVMPSMNLQTVIEDFFYKYRQTVFPVVADEKLVGCIRSEDLRGISKQDRGELRVKDVMAKCNKEQTLISPDEDAYRALERLQKTSTSQLVVADGDRFVGTVSLGDIGKFLSIKMEIEGGSRVLHESLSA